MTSVLNNSTPSAASAPRSGWINWVDFWSTPLREDWLVENLIARGSQTVLAGQKGAGKSLLALEVAVAEATGRQVLGSSPSDPEPVVYLDFENNRDILKARLLQMGYDPSTDLENLHYWSLSPLPPLDQRAGSVQIQKMCDEFSPVLVVIDTLSRVISGDENEAKTFANFDAMTASILRERGIALLIIDHLGKNTELGQRGSSAKGADADVTWKLVMKNEDSAGTASITLTIDKRRIPWVPREIQLRRISQPLLCHELISASVDGVEEVLASMKRLNIPAEWSWDKIFHALRAQHLTFGEMQIRAALKQLREKRRTAPVEEVHFRSLASNPAHLVSDEVGEDDDDDLFAPA